MVQFLSLIFFLAFLQFLLGFSKVPVFLCHPVYRNSVVCSRNDCMPRKRNNIVDLHVAVNNTNMFSVAMEMQLWAPFALLLDYRQKQLAMLSI